MNQELILETKKTLQAIFSTACDQALLICVGDFSPILIQGLKQNIQSHQQVLVINSQDNFDTFLNSCRSILDSAAEMRYRIIQENETEHRLTGHIKNQISGITKEITGKRYRTELQFHNFFMNIPELCLGQGISKLKNIAKGKNVVVLGAGPSLKEKIPWIKKNRNNLFIIASGSIASGLCENDIHPNLYVETDHRAPTHWENINPENYYLAATTTITAGLASRFKQVFWMESCTLHRDWIYEWEKKFCPGIDRLKSPDQNTGLSAVGAAEYCGAESIILVGIDLCLSPDGNSHSSFFHRGKDKVEISQQMRYVENNKGEDCPTIYGTFINGFNELISRCPETQFIQTSESGICLNGAVYKKIEDCVLLESKYEIETFESEFKFNEIRSAFKELKKHLVNFNGIPENAFQQQLLDIIKINSCMTSASIEEEFTRQKEKYLNYLSLFQKCLYELQSDSKPMESLHEFLPPEIKEVGVQIDWEKEYTLAGFALDLEITESQNWKLDWQRTHMMQLLIQKEGRWMPVSGQYEITEKAGELINYSLKMHKGSFDKVICLGVWDGNYISIMASKFAHCQFTIIEPNTQLLAKMLKYVPLASKLPKNTKWLQSIETLKTTDLENCLLICPDTNGEYLPELGQMFKQFKNL